jgi:hypothetical protein
MALDTRSLKRLRKRMPTGYLNLAIERLAQKGRDLSDSYISQNINGDRFDQGVIEVLIELADENDARHTNLKARANGKHITA